MVGGKMMDKVLINIEEEEWLHKFFNTDVISIDDLFNCIEKLDSEIYELKERIEELTDPEYGKPDAYDEWRDSQ
jgi:hypothetical protein